MEFTLVVATQYSFLLSLLGMSAATLFFALSKSSVAPEFQSNASTSAVICFVAALTYLMINSRYGIGTSSLATGAYPTTLRYLDWLLTTPMIVLKFPELLGDDERGPAIAVLVVVADLLMIIFGFFGEASTNHLESASAVSWMAFGVASLAWLFVIFILYSSVSIAARDKLGPIRTGLDRLKLFIVFGWAIYPAGYLLALGGGSQDGRVLRELIYNFADLFNKVGFGLVALYSVRQMQKERDIRAALAAL